MSTPPKNPITSKIEKHASATTLAALLFGISCVFGSMNVSAESEIGGDLDMDISVENVISAAIGNDNTSQVRIGAIVDSKIGGDVEIQVNAENVIAAAIGSDNTAEVNMGSIADSEIGGSVSIRVDAANVIAAAIGTGNTAEVSLGAVK